MFINLSAVCLSVYQYVHLSVCLRLRNCLWHCIQMQLLRRLSDDGVFQSSRVSRRGVAAQSQQNHETETKEDEGAGGVGDGGWSED